MAALNKLFYIAISSGIFGFLFYIGNEVRSGEDFAGSGTGGIVRFLSNLLGVLTQVLGQAGVGGIIMLAALFGGIYAAITIWRDDLFF